jgi:hypothetical protein
VFHTLGANQLISQSFDLGGFTSHHDDFQTMVGVEVNMQR